METKNNNTKKLNPVFWTALVLFLACMNISPLKAQSADEEETPVPDDSILVYEQYLDSIPEKYMQADKKYKVVMAFLDDNSMRFDDFPVAEGKLLITYPTEVADKIRLYDRKVNVRYVVSVDNSNRILVRTYATEKIDSKNKNYWRILERKSKERIIAQSIGFCKGLKKRFRGKVTSGIAGSGTTATPAPKQQGASATAAPSTN